MLNTIKSNIYQFELNVEDVSTGKKSSVSGQINDIDGDILKKFIVLGKELWKTKYLNIDKQASLQIKWDQKSGFKSIPYLPDTDLIDAFLYRMRPFILNDEKTNFLRVCNILNKYLDNEIIRGFIKSQKNLWAGVHHRSMFQISDKEGILNTDESLMKYINSYEYHRDEKKEKRFTNIKNYFKDDGLRAFYLMLILEKAKAISNIMELCEIILGFETNSIFRYKSKKKRVT